MKWSWIFGAGIALIALGFIIFWPKSASALIELIFSHAVKRISSPGVRRLCSNHNTALKFWCWAVLWLVTTNSKMVKIYFCNGRLPVCRTERLGLLEASQRSWCYSRMGEYRASSSQNNIWCSLLSNLLVPSNRSKNNKVWTRLLLDLCIALPLFVWWKMEKMSYLLWIYSPRRIEKCYVRTLEGAQNQWWNWNEINETPKRLSLCLASYRLSQSLWWKWSSTSKRQN